ncbi:MAG: helix-turn-helix transcriptional regulator [Bacteroidales bacterium]|nr:helix-turn-helix transcriptional regulator [Bacteroidales bacterium]
MNDRLKQFLSMENLSPARFAEVMGIQRSGISHLLAGRNKPSFEFIQKMMTAYPDINYEWLILGKGRPYKSDRQPAIPSNPTDLFTESSEAITDSTDEITPENQQLIDENPASEPFENRIFANSTTPALPKLSKKIARIIVFFNDGTYEEK